MSDADTLRQFVESWGDVTVRISGIPDHFGDYDGMDIGMGELTQPNSVVELVVDDEVIAVLIEEDSEY